MVGPGVQLRLVSTEFELSSRCDGRKDEVLSVSTGRRYSIDLGTVHAQTSKPQMEIRIDFQVVGDIFVGHADVSTLLSETVSWSKHVL